MMIFVNDRKELLVITQNGEAKAVLIDVESYPKDNMRSGTLYNFRLQFY